MNVTTTPPLVKFTPFSLVIEVESQEEFDAWQAMFRANIGVPKTVFDSGPGHTLLQSMMGHVYSELRKRTK